VGRCAIAILQLIDQLQALLSHGTPIPFTKYRVVQAEELEQLLDRMRINVPNSIRESERTLSERDRLISDAKAEAERVVQQARQQAMEMIGERSLLATAQVESDRVIAEAKEIARQRADAADTYAMTVLRDLAQHLQGTLQQVENGIRIMQEGAQPPSAPEAGERPAREERPTREERPEPRRPRLGGKGPGPQAPPAAS
jgi:vacuolar-type H+-ATPase subunit H